MHSFQRFVQCAVLGAALCGIATSAAAEFDRVFRTGFETPVAMVGPPLVDVVLNPGASTTIPGASGSMTVSATGTCATHVIAGNGITEFGEAVSVLDLQGCPAGITMQPTSTKAAKAFGPGTGPGNCGVSGETGYAVLNCWGTAEAVFARGEFNDEFIGYGRVPFDDVVFGFRLAEPAATATLLRRYAHKRLVSSALLACSHPACSLSGGVLQVGGQPTMPVLLVHGYQGEPLGALGNSPIKDNGGQDYFDQLPDRLVSHGYYPLEFRWVSNARFKDVARDLSAAIDEIHSATGQNVHVVAHSFGGLLARTLLQSQEGLSAVAKVASLTTVGTPHSGIAPTIAQFNGIRVPNGQDAPAIFVNCGQISCEQAGQPTLNPLFAELMSVGSTGSLIATLDSTKSNLPNINIQVLLGFASPGIDLPINGWQLRQGDGLISGWGQRFYPLLAVSSGVSAHHSWSPLLSDRFIGGALVSERILGRGAPEPATAWQWVAPGDEVSTEFNRFIHSEGTDFNLLNPVNYDYIQVAVRDGEGIGSGFVFHDALARILDFLPAPSPDNGLINGAAVSGAISSPGEVDTFTFQANAGDSIVLTTTRTSGDFYPYMRLYSPSGSLVDSDYEFNVASISRLISVSGTYTLLISDGSSSEARTGGYDIQLARIPGVNEHGALINGGIRSEALTVGDLDTFTFNVVAGESIVLTTTRTSGDFGPYMRLYSPSGSLVDSDYEFNVASISRSISVSGTYTLLISDGSSSEAQTGGYDIQFVR